MKKLLMLLVIVGMLISAGCKDTSPKRQGGYHQIQKQEEREAVERTRNPHNMTDKEYKEFRIWEKEQEEAKRIYKRLEKGEIWLSMTDKQARISRGRPKDINRSVGRWGVHEQWVYENKYLYFENGILTSWQD